MTPEERAEWREDAEHVFDYIEHDTGLPRCRHASHGGHSTAACWKAAACRT